MVLGKRGGGQHPVLVGNVYGRPRNNQEEKFEGSEEAISIWKWGTSRRNLATMKSKNATEKKGGEKRGVLVF